VSVEVTLITPSLPGREHMLAETVRSVQAQTMPCEHLWAVDHDRLGPAPVRNNLLADVTTELVGFVDDDDVLYPRHVEHCLTALRESDACVAYPWFRFDHPRGWWPLGEFLQIQRPDGTRVHAFEQPFDPAALEHNNYIPITVIARTECLRKVGGLPLPGTAEWPHESNEDWGLWRRLVAAGHTFAHVPEVTWEYRVHGGNTSGRRAA
jgi:Glycosyltransferase like family 2